MRSLAPLVSFLTAMLALVAPARADEATPSDVAREATIDASAGVQMISRRFDYTDDVYGFLRPYTLPAGPAVSFDVRYFPGRHFTNGVGSKFGVDVRFDRSFGIRSERDDLLSYDTVHRIYEISAMFRWMFGRHALIGSFGYGNHAFELRNVRGASPGLNTTPDLPNVGYSYLRYGVETRIAPKQRLGLAGGLAYLQVLDAGGIQSDPWFPRSHAGGIALHADLVLALPRHWEIRAGIEHRRYFHSMNVRVGDPFIAGGALDRFVTAQLRAAFRY